EPKTIIVKNLSWNVDEDWLRTEFAACGEITGVRIQLDRDTGRSRGFGFIDFTEPAAVTKALETLQGHEIDGREVTIDKCESNPRNKEARANKFGDTPSAPSQTLFVGNVSFDCDEDTLWQAFADFGSVKSVRLPTDRDTGKPKGFGYVEFEDQAGATAAFQAGTQGLEIAGRSVRLDYSQPRDNSGGDRGGRGGFGGRGGGRGGFGGDRGG
ncbi:RNA-binding domain-containing protein, partial [Calocera cornea HHB12733]